jgi:UDP-glucose 4-epimerase
MKVLITGVAGFIGAHVASRFVKEGYDVTGVDDLSNGKAENVPAGVNFIKADLSDKSIIQSLPAGCKVILHLAGQSSGEISFDDPVADLKKNTASTLNLIQYGIRHKMERIVYASSMSVYGNVDDKPINELNETSPLSCYGVSKLASERYLKVYSSKLPYVAMRMFNVYGPGQDLNNLRQGMVSIYLAQALKSGEIVVKGGINRYRDLIYIDDVVESWYRAASYEAAKNEIFNLGTGRKTTVGDLLDKVCRAVPGATYTIHDPTPGDQNGIYADNEKLKEKLQMSEFVDADNGLAVFAEWARSQKF